MSIPGAIVDSAPVAAGTFAPADAEYLVLALSGVLTMERLFTPGVGLSAVDGGPGGLYTLNATAGAGPWDTTGTVVHLDISTNNVTIGSAANFGKLGVIGDTDEIQLFVRGDAGQAANIVTVEDSASSPFVVVEASGDVLIGAATSFSTEFVLVQKNQNANTSLGIVNTTSGTLAGATLGVESDIGGTAVVGIFTAYSPGFTPVSGAEADSVAVESLGAASGLIFNTRDTTPMKWKTGAVERMRLLGSSAQLIIGGTTAVGAEALRVVGAARIEGKLTVTGAIDPTSLTLSGGGTAHFYDSADGSTAPVSGAATGRIRYNNTVGTGQWEVSTQGGAYAAIGTTANAFIQGGNSFGGLATLGTNDANALAFETTGVERARILAAANTLEGNAGFTIQGGAAAGNNLTLLGTGNVTAGNIIFRRFSGETARFVSNGPVLVFQATTAIAPSNDHIQGDKTLDGSYNGMRARNLSAGTLALSEFVAQNNSLDFAQLGITSSGFSGAFGARTTFIQSRAGTGGLLLTVFNAAPMKFETTAVERFRILAASNTIEGNAGLTVQGGSGVHTLTLVGGAGVASTLRLGIVAGDLIGMYGVAAVAQHSTTGQTAGFTAGVGASVLVDSTFTGGTGATAYTIGDIVRALKQLGVMLV